jgi:ribonuclease/clavin/mitogillin
VAAILLTHHHRDHTGFAAALRERTGAPIHAHAATAERVDFPVDVLLADGAEVDLDDGFVISAMHTPGHAPGHLVYSERRTGLVYAGDMVAGVGTILIDPEDDGDMIAYLASLERIAAAGPVALVPAHGPVLDDPQGLLRRYRAHRLMREDRVLAAIPRCRAISPRCWPTPTRTRRGAVASGGPLARGPPAQAGGSRAGASVAELRFGSAGAGSGER